MLCALLVAGENGLSVEALAEAVWGDDDVHAHGGPLKAIMSMLRKTLGRERIPLGSSSRYRIALDLDDRLDLEEFRALTREGARLVTAEEHAAAAKLLGQAVKLWGVPPLPDLPDHYGVLWDARQDLLGERRDAQLALWEARLHLGENRDVVREVRGELADDPLSEALHRLVMLGLFRSGQRIEALQHYAAAEELFKRETGSRPGGKLRRLRDAIDADDDVDGTTPASPAVQIVPAQLPPALFDFTGREADTAVLVEWLTPASDTTALPVVAVSGPGGIGKSALAAHVAHKVRASYPDGQLYAHLAGMSGQPRQVGDVLAEFLHSLGVRGLMPRTAWERSALLRSLLAGRRVLLLLDDAGPMHQVQHLLPGTAGCAVIITSRIHAADAASRHVRLHPLPHQEAVDLLGEIVGPDRVAAEPDAAASVVEACGGFPLAIRVAGARLSAQPYWSMAYFSGLMGERVADADGVELSTRVAADSYGALGGDAQRAFRAVSLVGQGDWPSWVVAMLLGGGGGDGDGDGDGERLVELLSAHSLIAPAGVDGMGQPRYRQHDLLRSYGAARIASDVGERDAATRRLELGWLELADRADSHIQPEPHHPPTQRHGTSLYAPAAASALIDADARGWFDIEINNILAVIRLAGQEGQVDRAVGLALTVNSYLFWARRDGDAEDMWRAIIEAATAGGHAGLAAEARLRMATLISRLPGGAKRSMSMFDKCVQVFDDLGDGQALARSLAARVFSIWILTTENRASPHSGALLERGVADSVRGLEAARTAGDAYTELACVRSLGLMHACRGDFAQATSLCEESLGMAAGIGARTGQRAYEAYTMRLLILVRLAAGDFEEALALAGRGRELVRMFGYPAGEASFEEQAGEALSGLGRLAEAVTRYGAAADLYSEDLAPYHRARCLEKRASAAARLVSL
ncbi:BTAD domain-containing putative transcriptional regulator [Planotetraspora sp. GP83]|uniref:ATP-binding protein n=1 Tax=Planotetraspora sp. GP83 TaxID=3156264 RepID=UPI0035148693